MFRGTTSGGRGAREQVLPAASQFPSSAPYWQSLKSKYEVSASQPQHHRTQDGFTAKRQRLSDRRSTLQDFQPQNTKALLFKSFLCLQFSDKVKYQGSRGETVVSYNVTQSTLSSQGGLWIKNEDGKGHSACIF